MILIGVDTGGTFTDIAAADMALGKLWIGKVASTPSDPSRAFLAGISEAKRHAAGTVGVVAHGTTVATNAILENKGARAALIVTRGFRHMLDIGRHDIPRDVNMFRWAKPERPITADLVFEVDERIDPSGAVLKPLDEASLAEALEAVRKCAAESVAISLLHSYANPAHEERVAAALREALPGLEVCLSSAVLPAFREYERTLLTAMNAKVMPLMGGYVRRVRSGLRDAGIAAPFFIIKSNGGISGAEVVAEQPVYTAMSGLAAGVVGACMVGRAAGFPDLISLDIGGTSTDVALCPGGEPVVGPETQIGQLPLKAPSVDVRTIGAGGGSIASVRQNRSLVVGPESAGADPGPVAYGSGGLEPTVTDAHAALGHLPGELAGGKIVLRPDLARKALQQRVADRLGLSVDDAAHGVLEILNHNIAGAIRAVSIERGYDPASHALVAFGGAGPLHACALAEILGMPVVIFPRYPGVLSALGLLATPLRQDYILTCWETGPDYDLGRLTHAFERLEKQANAWFDAESLPPAQRRFERMLDARYLQQGYEIQVPVAPEHYPLDAARMAKVEAAFHELHKRLYGYARFGSPVQIVNVRLCAIGELPRFQMSKLAATGSAPKPAGERRMLLERDAGHVLVPAYQRDALGPGAVLAGPCVVDQLDTTVLLGSRWSASVDAYGNLVAKAKP